MLRCPNCHNYTISFWDKFFLLPIKQRRGETVCKQCGNILTVPSWTRVYLLFMSLVYVIIVTVLGINHYLNKYIFFIILTVLYFLTISVPIPLTKKNS